MLEQLPTGSFKEEGRFVINSLEVVELMSLASGEAPLADESQGQCRLRLIGENSKWMFRSRCGTGPSWMNQLMAKARCDL